MERKLLLLIALLMYSAGFSQVPVWTSKGIGGGGAFFSPVISPHDKNEIWVSSDMSGFYRSTQFGRSWSLVHAEELQGGTTVSLSFTSNPDSIFAIDHSAQNGIDMSRPVVSTDGGVTWNSLPDPSNGEAYTIYADPNRTDTYFLAGYDKLWFTNNSGTNYQLIYTFSNGGNGIHLAGAFFDGNFIYVGTSAGMLYSGNGGSLWIPMTLTGWPAGMGMGSFAGARDGNAVKLYATAFPQIDLYAGITGADFSASAGIYSCDGASTSWTQRMNGISANHKIFFIGCALNDINTIYAAGGDQNNGVPVIYKTTTAGSSWTNTFLTTLNNNIITGWSGDGGDRGWGYGEYVLGLTVAPNDKNQIAFTDLGFVHVSTNGGTTWRQAYVNDADENLNGVNTPVLKSYNGIGLENTSHWMLCWNNNQQLFSAASDINGIRSDDGGESWRMATATTQNTTYYVLKHPVSSVLYAATSTVHDMYQTTYLTDARIDPGLGTIRYSNNNGTSWTTLHDFNHPVIWLAADPTNSNRLFASVIHYAMGVGEGGIWKTENLNAGSASTWVKLNNPPRTEGHPFNIIVLNDGSLVASYSARRDASGAFTASSGVFYLPAGSSTWSDRSDAGMMYYTKDIVIDPTDPTQNTWYACIWSGWGGPPNGLGGLYKTTNRGQSWTRIFNGVDRVSSISFHPTNTGEAWISTETSGLWKATGMNTANPVFQREHSFPFKQPERIFFRNNEMWVTTFGGGLFKSPTTPTGTAEINPAEYLQFTNPNNGTFQLSIKKPVDKIYLSDMLGRYITELPSAGGLIQLPHLEKGIYFIIISTEGKQSGSQMVIH
jgi:hypothetical protein